MGENVSTVSTPATTNVTYLECNEISTGAILLADIIPTLLIKLTAPFFILHISYKIRVLVCVLFSLASFLVVSFSTGIWMSILGVVCASISGGLGETTYFGFSSYFEKNVISAYSSGTGGAGIFGALSYAGLTSAGLTPRSTLLVMTVVPVIMFISFFIVIKKPRQFYQKEYFIKYSEDTSTLLSESEDADDKRKGKLTMRDKLHLLKPLLKYMIPLCVVYIAEYFINQGLYELLYFNDIWLSEKEQYRWYQVDYQLGVFISRSSVNMLKINNLWMLPILQCVNVAILTAQVFLRFIPNIWIIFAIVLFEGLLGGAAFVNTFYKISEDIEAEFKEFSLSAATIADSFGITLAGAISIPTHNHICSLNLKM
ncbi:battenin-like isoform X2 [Ostrea edulis]|uniref:battenin-like isoform X2 n=1 Tax=Ostrea edulis TaxID=37623 RepID=UPI0020957479|nr:battenin-like isoform X2 [Ostrea edulis]